MLHSKSFVFVFTLFLLFLFSNCNENNVVSPDDISSPKRLSKIVQDANNYSTFSYINEKLSKFDQISESNLFSSIILNYNGNDRPQTETYMHNSENLLKKYYYDSNERLDKMEYTFKDSLNNFSLDGYIKYFYNNLNKLVKTEQYNPQDEMTLYAEYNYGNSNNITEKRIYYTDGLAEVITMKYDNKINPWYNLRKWLIYDITLSKNNIINSSITYINNNQDNTVTNYVYSYGPDGYPVSRTIETDNDLNPKITETYAYK